MNIFQILTSVALLLLSHLSFVLASSEDRKWLLKMMLGLPADESSALSSYDPVWNSLDGGAEPQFESWPSEGDLGNYEGLYSIPELNHHPGPQQSQPEQQQEGEIQNIDKKWSKHGANHFFSGFICCNQPPTPYPKIKRHKRPNDQNLREIILRRISRTLARNQLGENPRQPLLDARYSDRLPSGIVGSSYHDIKSRFPDLPYVDAVDNNGFDDMVGQLKSNVQRRGVTAVGRLGTTLQPKRGVKLRGFVSKATSPVMPMKKRSEQDNHDVDLFLIHFVIFAPRKFVNKLLESKRTANSSNNEFDPDFDSMAGGR